MTSEKQAYSKQKRLLPPFWAKTISLVSILGLSMIAYAFDGDIWKEEVLLHDGSKIVATRSQTYGGRHEIGQPPPIKEQTIAVTLPSTNKTITWTSDYDDDLGRTNFNMLALHILNGTAYIVVEPNLILSYKKWGQPNPPYLFFRYNGKAWQRITLEEFPPELNNINLVVNTLAHGKELSHQGLATVEVVKGLNKSLTQEEYKSIVRHPLEHWKPRPEHKGPKAPHPISQPATTEGSN